MPLYEYECQSCAHRFERIQRFSDPPPGECPNCGGPVQKLFSSPAIQFKGSGFYITDYARSGSGAEKPAESKGSPSGDSAPAAGASSSSDSAKSDKAPAPSPAPAATGTTKAD